MFGSKKNKEKKKAKEAEKAATAKAEHSQKIREEALAQTRAAKAAIGDEALEKIAALMEQKQNSATEKAKEDIANADAHRVADEILLMLEDRE